MGGQCATSMYGFDGRGLLAVRVQELDDANGFLNLLLLSLQHDATKHLG
jgi:hypothetical protein